MTDDLDRERWIGHRYQHESESEARALAVAALDKRLDAMNEFRDQLRDQAATFVRVDVFDRLEAQVEHRLEELRQQIAAEREERRDQQNLRQGKTAGISQTAGILLGVVAVTGTVVGIIGVIVAMIR